jgi:hypothetical protein
MVYRKK